MIFKCVGKTSNSVEIYYLPFNLGTSGNPRVSDVSYPYSGEYSYEGWQHIGISSTDF